MDGSFFIGRSTVRRPETFQAINPALGGLLDPNFSVSSAVDVGDACRLAEEAFDSFRELAPAIRADFLEAVAGRIEGIGEALIERAHLETGLPVARIAGECNRTTGQLRLFARVLRDGYWADVTLDEAQPDRMPLPRADLRSRRIPLGPVAVFGASNFPLAFSVAGGDTASAWAAGCPVVVKGHPAHPGTSALVGDAVRETVAAFGLHEGVFSLLQGASNTIGSALVSNPLIKAVSFTGSRAGGLALVDIAARRPEPIPVYAEMSSVNPVLLLPAALATRGVALARGFVASLTMGSGQFCTNPGIVLAINGGDLDAFVQAAAETLLRVQPQVMLTSTIHESFDRGVAMLEAHEGVKPVARGADAVDVNRGRAALFETTAPEFLRDPRLSHEVFGAASLIVRCADLDELVAVLQGMEGQLTATLHMDEGDHRAAATLVPLLERKVGRILANGWPTGVEVCDAMVHGGPYPATSDSRTTSVGSLAIDRFLRPVCYQDLPQDVLPPALRDANPLCLPQCRDGQPISLCCPTNLT
jgi:alpha-ketoglutaric semialdehyde dehydrogenase